MLGHELKKVKFYGSQTSINTEDLLPGIFIAVIYSANGKKEMLVVKGK